MKEKIPMVVIICVLLLGTASLSAIASVSDLELPPTTGYVTMRATDGIDSWFDMNISDVPSGYDITNGTYLGWCAQKSIAMTRGVNHSVRLYSSYDPNMPESYKSENWSKINYILNHKQGDKNSIQEVIWYYISLDSYPSDPDAQAMIVDADENGSDFIPEDGQILAIIVEGVETIQRSFFEYTIPILPPDEPNEPPSEPPSGPTGGIAQNHAPTADATAGEPYTGLARGEITFDGSDSYDRDGMIISWKWDFGDGTTGSGKIVKHSYAAPGEYTVTLTVKDEKGATDSYATKATIIEGNNQPNTPTISGPTSGNKNTSYDFTVVSTDPDDDSLQYIIDWDDGEIMSTVYSPSGTPMIRSHAWVEPGHYTITVKASDNNKESGTVTIDILIDIVYIHATGTKTKVEKLDNGNYLIDIDGDGTQYYEYSSASGEINAYQEQPVFMYLLVAVIFIACLVVFFFLERRRKRSKL